MKHLLSFLLVFALLLSFGCKDDTDDNSALSPISDTTIHPGYEEFYTDQSDIDTNQNNLIDTNTVVDDNSAIMVEDTTGNIQPATNDDLTQNGNSYYLIVGSYQNINNAQIRVQYFKNQGYTAEILPKFGNYNRVSVAKFNTENDARTELKRLKTKYNDNTFWLLLR